MTNENLWNCTFRREYYDELMRIIAMYVYIYLLLSRQSRESKVHQPRLGKLQ